MLRPDALVPDETRRLRERTGKEMGDGGYVWEVEAWFEEVAWRRKLHWRERWQVGWNIDDVRDGKNAGGGNVEE